MGAEMNWLLLAAEQVSKPYTFAEYVEPFKVLGQKECLKCGKEFDVSEKHPEKMFCSVVCGHAFRKKKRREKK